MAIGRKCWHKWALNNLPFSSMKRLRTSAALNHNRWICSAVDVIAYRISAAVDVLPCIIYAALDVKACRIAAALDVKPCRISATFDIVLCWISTALNFHKLQTTTSREASRTSCSHALQFFVTTIQNFCSPGCSNMSNKIEIKRLNILRDKSKVYICSFLIVQSIKCTLPRVINQLS